MSISLAALLMIIFFTLAYEICAICEFGGSRWVVVGRMLQAFAVLWVVIETMRP